MDNNVKDIITPTIENKFNQLKPMVPAMMNDNSDSDFIEDIVKRIGLPEFLDKYTDSREVRFINNNGDTMLRVEYRTFPKRVVEIDMSYNYFMLTYFGVNRMEDFFNTDILNVLVDIFRKLLHIPENVIVSLYWN